MAPGAKPRRAPAARSPAAPSQPAPGYGRVLTCLRVRPALTDEEGGVDSVALQCDTSTAKVWALGSAGGEEEAPRQFAFDQLLEQEQGQADLYEAVGAPAVNAALAGGVGCVLCYGAQGAGKWYSMHCERVGQEGLLPHINSVLFAGPKLGLAFHDDGSVSSVMPGGEAEAAGIRLDDRITCVGKTPTLPSKESVVAAVVAHPERPIRLTIQRMLHEEPPPASEGEPEIDKTPQKDGDFVVSME